MNEAASFIPLTWADLLHLAPELSLSVLFIGIVLLDLVLPNRMGRMWVGWLVFGSLLASLALVIWQLLDRNGSGDAAAETIRLLANSYRVDDFAGLLKIILLTGTALIALMAIGTVKNDEAITARSEYFYLMLPAVTGAMAMASAGNFVSLYIGLELLSITSYVLVGLRRKSSKSAEAAFKYVVTGGISSAFILFGMSYIYGVTGSVDLGQIREALPAALTDFKALLYIGFFFMIAGFGLKIAAAPFHAWAPDVYQGAPTPVAAFLAVVSKGAAVAAVFRIMYNTALLAAADGDTHIPDDVFLAMLVLAAAAMLVGTTAALRQKQAKRLLALSGVANAGYLLVPIGISLTSVHSNNFAEFIYYLAAYLFMTLGAFSVLTAVSRTAGEGEMKDFTGMYYRAPWTAAAMVLFIVSLAGLPVSGGFFGKLFILLGAASMKAYWLVAIMVVSSVISYYFYFGFVRQMFMRSGAEEANIRISFATGTVIWLCAAATLALGLFPGPVLEWINSVFSLRVDLLVN